MTFFKLNCILPNKVIEKIKFKLVVVSKSVQAFIFI